MRYGQEGNLGKDPKTLGLREQMLQTIDTELQLQDPWI
jgi:hypothetical protein